jgi:hypothetical protein
VGVPRATGSWELGALGPGPGPSVADACRLPSQQPAAAARAMETRAKSEAAQPARSEERRAKKNNTIFYIEV